MFKNKKAFTLVELLVVVLIIGILAAIAVPQYSKAVAKSELAQIISLTKSVKQAQQRYYMQTGQYANNLSQLDITVNDEKVNCAIGAESGGYVRCYNENFAIWSYMGRKYTECEAKTNDKNSARATACNDFTQGSSTLSSDPTTCYTVGIKPCFASYSTTMDF